MKGRVLAGLWVPHGPCWHFESPPLLPLRLSPLSMRTRRDSEDGLSLSPASAAYASRDFEQVPYLYWALSFSSAEWRKRLPATRGDCEG